MFIEGLLQGQYWATAVDKPDMPLPSWSVQCRMGGKSFWFVFLNKGDLNLLRDLNLSIGVSSSAL